MYSLLRVFIGILACLLLLVTGCGPSLIEAPYVDAASAVKAAMAQYDSNGNGYLEAPELEKAPGLRSVVERGDEDKDTRLSTSELTKRIKTIVGDEVGMMSLSARVLYDGLPVKGAEVKFIPEPCLGPTFKPGTGITDAQGLAGMRMANDDFPGMQCGLFRVEIYLKDESGKEFIPSKYNTETILGADVSLDAPNLERGLTFSLESEPKAK